MTTAISSGSTPLSLRFSTSPFWRSRFKISLRLADSLSPTPVSTRIFFPWDSMIRQFRAIGTRFRSSGAMIFSQRRRGTTPKWAPPSSQKVPSETISSRTWPRSIRLASYCLLHHLRTPS